MQEEHKKETSEINAELRETLFRDTVEANASLSKMFVKFTKKDGTEREMEFTTSPRLIPENRQPKTISTISSNKKTSARVWDLNVKDWRSFRYDSIIDMHIREILS